MSKEKNAKSWTESCRKQEQNGKLIILPMTFIGFATRRFPFVNNTVRYFTRNQRSVDKSNYGLSNFKWNDIRYTHPRYDNLLFFSFYWRKSGS
jgi:hypothetical protein